MFSVFWEISFCGGIEDRDEKVKDLKESIKEFEKAKEEGTLKMYSSVDEFFDEIEKRIREDGDGV